MNELLLNHVTTSYAQIALVFYGEGCLKYFTALISLSLAHAFDFLLSPTSPKFAANTRIILNIKRQLMYKVKILNGYPSRLACQACYNIKLI